MDEEIALRDMVLSGTYTFKGETYDYEIDLYQLEFEGNELVHAVKKELEQGAWQRHLDREKYEDE